MGKEHHKPPIRYKLKTNIKKKGEQRNPEKFGWRLLDDAVRNIKGNEEKTL